MHSPARILVVDDNQINLEICQEILDRDFKVFTATNAHEALRLARQHAPQIVLLDIMLPGVDGLEACRRLRQLPETRWATIIMVSAKAMPSERAAGFAAGADAYVTKPFDYDDLLSAIHAQADAIENE
jgi:CheY-like chemotaxis protein